LGLQLKLKCKVYRVFLLHTCVSVYVSLYVPSLILASEEEHEIHGLPLPEN
jgi:hypothetical protein